MSRRYRGISLVRLIVGLGVVACVGAAGYAGWQYARPVVTVTEAVEGPVVHAFYATGTVLPQREFPIKANLAGILTEVRVDKGDRVKRGQVLAVVSAPEMVFKQRQAEAELAEMVRLADASTSPVLGEYDKRLEAADAILELAKKDRDRLAASLQTRATSMADVDRAEERVRAAWSEVESIKAQKEAKKIQLQRQVDVARAALDIAKWNAEQQSIASPIDGAVLDRPTSLGTRVAINDHLMQVADVSPPNMVMRSSVDEEDVGQVRQDQTVRMTLYSFPGEVFEGRVEKIYDKADPDRRTFEVDVKFGKEDTRLAAGMTGELAFILSEKARALVVPSQALQAGGVWTVKDGQLVRNEVEVGLKSVERVEIVRGVGVGEKVVVTPVGAMTEGRSVREKYMEPGAAAGMNKPKAEEAKFKGFKG
jgi:HlyD family secretion protein